MKAESQLVRSDSAPPLDAAGGRGPQAQRDHQRLVIVEEERRERLPAASRCDYISINYNCLDGVELSALPVIYWDGRHNNWYAGPRPTPWPIMGATTPTVPATTA